MSVTEELTAALAGRYLVEREVGRGGMATVYLARDLRHERPVALKVLLPELGAVLGPERFLAEIRVTANLQHPNLLPLFDSGEAAGRLFYVMPYVEGESLRVRLDRERQLPVDEAVRLAAALAAALDSAHRRGVVHRDLKPENILLQDGQPLVADFGIALAVSKAGGARVTQTGLSLGTPQYMSPEQAAADRTIDGRSDVYSLACVLYEMLTGDPPHTGSTVQAVIARVLTEAPRSVRALRPSIPEHVDQALQRALEKLPADRWPTAAQFGEALHARAGDDGSPPRRSDHALAAHAASGPARMWHALPRGRVLLLGALLGVVLGASAAATWARARGRARSAPAPVRFALAVPATERVDAAWFAPVAFSPDGRTVAYVGRSGAAGEGRLIYLRPLDQLESRPLPGTEDGREPFFSPDGRWLGFFVGSTLRKVPVGGGPAMTVAALTGDVDMGAWTRGGEIVVGSARGLVRVPADGSAPVPLTTADTARDAYHAAPLLLPDGKTVVFWVERRAGAAHRLGVAVLGDTGHTVLDAQGTNPVGFVDGTLFFGRRDGTVAAAPFDVRRRRLTAAPVPVLEGVREHAYGYAAASLSRHGALVYVRGSSLTRPALVDERGADATPLPGVAAARRYANPRISPDGRRIALAITAPGASGQSDIWTYDIAAGVLSRLTSRAPAIRPEWTPDGTRVAYIAEAVGRPSEAWWVPADGSGSEERLWARADSNMVREVTFSPDGRHAVFRTGSLDDVAMKRDLWLLPLGGLPAIATPGRELSGSSARDGTPPATVLLRTPFNELMPRVSPDGRWLAYTSDETGQYEVYVRPFPGPGGRVQVSSGRGTEPVWAPDGRRLLYRAGERFMEATLAPTSTTTPGVAGVTVAGTRVLFEGRYESGANDLSRAAYDVHPDGRRLVVLRPMADDAEVIVAVDWLTELRARGSTVRPQ